MTLRQFRAEAIIGFGLLVALAIVLAVTGGHLVDVNNAFESTCKAARDCGSSSNPVLNVDKPLQSALPFIVIMAPALIGIFFGAPLVARELELGTFRLAWTQSVTRRRWFVVKLAVVGIIAMMIGGLATWMSDWWASPLDAASKNRFGLAQFGFHGVAPIGYAAFAFALGAVAGVLLRRTVAAMAVTVVGFAAARLVVTYWLRPNLASPVHGSIPLAAGSGLGFNVFSGGGVSLNAPYVSVPNGWVYSTAVVNKAGRVPTSQYLRHTCPALFQFPRSGGGGSVVGEPPSRAAAGPPGFQSCVSKLSATLHTVVTYQPANRFWPFQWAEMGIFFAAALALCGLAYWWLRRQYS
jgi:hypothetical protein